MAVKKTTKSVVKKTVGKAVKAEAKVELDAAKSLRAPVVDTEGKSAGSVTLPSSYFDAKVNKQLVAQAVRVYLANQRAGHASTKTRGEVEGSTRKLYKQKGTGRARHGAIRAPIFVGGGIVFGPKPRDFRMNLTQKMRKVALASALTSKYKDGQIKIVSGLTELEPKTKVMAKTVAIVAGKGSTLLVVASDAKNVVRAARNIGNLDIVPVEAMHAYGVVAHTHVVFMKEAIALFK